MNLRVGYSRHQGTGMGLGKYLAGVVLSVLFALCCRGTAMAGQTSFDIDVRELRPHPSGESAAPKGSFEIDLKELRQAPASIAKPPRQGRRHGASSAPAATETVSREGTSSYTVKAGDFLFVILMREYGLSNAAAERMIPEVMRLNGIHSPQGLNVGQHLTIPLPAPTGSPHPVIGPKMPQPQPVAAQPAQSGTSSVPAEHQVSIPATPPCQLARAVAEQLGLLTVPIKPQPNRSAFTATSAGLKLVVACSLTPEEIYTHTRLLVFQHAQLLVFTGDEPPARVIEALADRLGLLFRRADPTRSDNLPLSYVFSAEGPADRDVRLTVRSAEGNEPPPHPASGSK